MVASDFENLDKFENLGKFDNLDKFRNLEKKDSEDKSSGRPADFPDEHMHRANPFLKHFEELEKKKK